MPARSAPRARAGEALRPLTPRIPLRGATRAGTGSSLAVDWAGQAPLALLADTVAFWLTGSGALLLPSTWT
jgi:hypothetical protein